MKYKLSSHAREELLRRNIPSSLLEDVLQSPQQVAPEPDGTKVFQSKLDFGEGKIFLLRAIVDDRIDPALVITLYRTSKIAKYWRPT